MKNKQKLSLHIPEPAHRPGNAPDFSGVIVPAAGSVRRPDIAVAPREITDLAYTLIRVLEMDGNAVGPWNPRLGSGHAAPWLAPDDADARL